MLIKLMTSENEKSHGSMMLRIGAIAFGLGTLIYTGLGMYGEGGRGGGEKGSWEGRGEIVILDN